MRIVYLPDENKAHKKEQTSLLDKEVKLASGEYGVAEKAETPTVSSALGNASEQSSKTANKTDNLPDYISVLDNNSVCLDSSNSKSEITTASSPTAKKLIRHNSQDSNFAGSSALEQNKNGSSGSKYAEELPLSRPLAHKRVFLGLITGTSTLLCVLLALGWGIPYIGFSNIHPSVPYITGSILITLILYIAWVAISLALQVITGHPGWSSAPTHGVTVRFFLPLMEAVGRVIGVAPVTVRSSFIQVNNEIVYSLGPKFNPEQVLILLPHCLQWSECPIRVSSKLDRCKKCGHCDISALLDLKNKYGVHLAIATGGTIARKLVVSLRPKMVIAVACERDLTSGIQDTYPLPVYGVLNIRPNGPCVDTQVDLATLEYSMRHFIKADKLPE